MKNLNTILILAGVMFFIAFFASNSLADPYIYFLGKNFGVMGIVYSTLVGVVMGWALKGIISGKSNGGYDSDGDDGEGF